MDAARQETATVPKTHFVREFFTQSNFNCRVWRETYYGYHAPWGRILSWVLFTSLMCTLSSVVILRSSNVPLFNGNNETDSLRESHYACFKSFCDAAHEMPLDCVVNSDGKSAHVDLENYDGPHHVPWPHSCRVAMNLTFGPEWDDFVDIPQNLFQLVKTGDNSENTTSFFKVYSSSCTFEISPPPLMLERDETVRETMANDYASNQNRKFPLLNFTDMEPGDKESFVLNKMVCPDDMPPSIRDNLIPAVKLAYELLLSHRYIVYGVFAFWFSLMSEVCYVILVALHLLPTTLLVRWLLPWPQDHIGYKQVGFWSTWSALVLSCTIMAERDFWDGAALIGLLSFVALYVHEDKQAAAEWAFLGLLWYGASDVYSMMDYIRSGLLVFDYFDIIGWAGSILGGFIPAHGWYKLVIVYVFGRTYASLKVIKHPESVGTDEADAYDNHVKFD